MTLLSLGRGSDDLEPGVELRYHSMRYLDWSLRVHQLTYVKRLNCVDSARSTWCHFLSLLSVIDHLLVKTMLL